MNWILNSGRCKRKFNSSSTRTNNEKKMLKNNRGFIGFGIPEEKRREKKSYTTIKQFNNFKKKAKHGDNISLYVNKIGIIAEGTYTGEFFKPQFRDEYAPDWSENEEQFHIGIQWNILSEPLDYIPKPITLYEK